MKPISPALQEKIISYLPNSNKSHRAIAAKYLCSPTIAGKVAKEVVPDKENLKGGRPKKLSAGDKRTIRQKLNLGRADNAVQVAQQLNPVLD